MVDHYGENNCNNMDQNFTLIFCAKFIVVVRILFAGSNLDNLTYCCINYNIIYNHGNKFGTWIQYIRLLLSLSLIDKHYTAGL